MSENSIPRFGGGTSVSLSTLISAQSIRTVLIALLCASVAVVVLRVFVVPPNGDEYIFLSNIHRAANGWRMALLQTAYVHLFWWLPYVGQDEIGQTIIGRAINVSLWVVSLGLLHRLGRHLLDPLGALVGVVLFALFSFSIANAANFRVDLLVLPVLLSVALLLLNPTTARVAAAGALSGLALALTIKASLWAPAFAGVLAVGLWDRQHRLRPILAGTIAGTATFIGILLAHRWAISTESQPGPGVSIDSFANFGTYMLFDGLFPMGTTFVNALVQNPPTWLLIAIGLVLAVAGLREPMARRNSLILLSLATPILCVAFYTNAFPYAYLVLMPTTCLLAGKAFSRFMGTAEGIKGVTALLCLGGAAVPMVYFALDWRLDRLQQERKVLAVVHHLFEEPVQYIDISGKVASFPRSNIALTRLWLVPYRRAEVPVVTNHIRESEPPLLIVNSMILDMWTDGVLDRIDPDLRLLPEDEETLRATYAHYWDQIYLAGRQWRDLGPGEQREFEIVVSGEHTLLADNPVIVDRQTYSPGATIALEAGRHELDTTGAEPDLRILWGKDLKRPSEGGLP